MARRKNVVGTLKVHVEGFDLKNIIYRQSEIIDNFCREEFKDESGKTITRIVDPVHMLLNQERLQSELGSMASKNFIDSFRNQKVDPFAELRSKCSDDDLKYMIKSRHLQAPAEILSWCKYMRDNMDIFNSEVQRLVDARIQQSQTEPHNNVEPSKSDE